MPEDSLPEDNNAEFMEPWRCESCKQLMYNVSADGYPSIGAPIGLTVCVDGDRLRVCLVCADMYVAVRKSGFMNEQHNLWVEERKHKRRLMSGSNYLDRNDQ